MIRKSICWDGLWLKERWYTSATFSLLISGNDVSQKMPKARGYEICRTMPVSSNVFLKCPDCNVGVCFKNKEILDKITYIEHLGREANDCRTECWKWTANDTPGTSFLIHRAHAKEVSFTVSQPLYRWDVENGIHLSFMGGQPVPYTFWTKSRPSHNVFDLLAALT